MPDLQSIIVGAANLILLWLLPGAHQLEEHNQAAASSTPRLVGGLAAAFGMGWLW